jgi:hypothetical protein
MSIPEPTEDIEIAGREEAFKDMEKRLLGAGASEISGDSVVGGSFSPSISRFTLIDYLENLLPVPIGFFAWADVDTIFWLAMKGDNVLAGNINPTITGFSYPPSDKEKATDEDLETYTSQIYCDYPTEGIWKYDLGKVYDEVIAYVKHKATVASYSSGTGRAYLEGSEDDSVWSEGEGETQNSITQTTYDPQILYAKFENVRYLRVRYGYISGTPRILQNMYEFMGFAPTQKITLKGNKEVRPLVWSPKKIDPPIYVFRFYKCTSAPAKIFISKIVGKPVLEL